uniref:Putative zinc finger CCCH domain-containing protein 67 n=1 Tax=Davidia involucrata TaxID=16924 RepID=A0A5B6Z193_DAVIN
MEGSEENSLPKPLLDEEKHEPQPQQLQELGLGFQSSTPSSPPAPKRDPILDPPPPPDCFDQQTINEELHNQQTMNEELQNHQTMNEEVQNQQTINEELQHQQNIDEELQNLVLEEKDTVHTDHEEDVNGEENKGNEKDADHEEVVKVEDKNENEDVKEEDGINNDDDNKTEDEDEDEDEEDEEAVKDEDNMDDNDKSGTEEGAEENENVGGDSTAVAVSNNGKYRRYHYPLRPDAEDCSYYMRTGTCKFGSNCKFNHPTRRRNQAAKEKVKEKENEESPERPGQTECKYYLRSGGCKFGKACRYNHGRGKTPVAPTLEYNFLGLPIRLGERECPYYMRNGSCKYGSNCRFNHPDPTAVGGGDPPGYGNGGSVSLQGVSQSTMSSWSSPRALNENAPFMRMMFSPTPGVPSPNPDWDGYQAPVYPTPERSLPTPPAFAMNNPATETNFYAHHQQQMVVEEFPERPGQPECSYFMKTGDCKFRSGCKFHHPKNRIPKTSSFSLSDKGLPLRPDQNICTHYNRYGICKFGPACKFDHPVDYAQSASSGLSGANHISFGNSTTADGARMPGSGNGSEPLIEWPV